MQSETSESVIVRMGRGTFEGHTSGVADLCFDGRRTFPRDPDLDRRLFLSLSFAVTFALVEGFLLLLDAGDPLPSLPLSVPLLELVLPEPSLPLLDDEESDDPERELPVEEEDLSRARLELAGFLLTSLDGGARSAAGFARSAIGFPRGRDRLSDPEEDALAARFLAGGAILQRMQTNERYFSNYLCNKFGEIIKLRYCILTLSTNELVYET